LETVATVAGAITGPGWWAGEAAGERSEQSACHWRAAWDW
jgi:hypothetical protein